MVDEAHHEAVRPGRSSHGLSSLSKEIGLQPITLDDVHPAHRGNSEVYDPHTSYRFSEVSCGDLETATAVAVHKTHDPLLSGDIHDAKTSATASQVTIRKVPGNEHILSNAILMKETAGEPEPVEIHPAHRKLIRKPQDTDRHSRESGISPVKEAYPVEDPADKHHRRRRDSRRSTEYCECPFDDVSNDL